MWTIKLVCVKGAFKMFQNLQENNKNNVLQFLQECLNETNKWVIEEAISQLPKLIQYSKTSSNFENTFNFALNFFSDYSNFQSDDEVKLFYFILVNFYFCL